MKTNSWRTATDATGGGRISGCLSLLTGGPGSHAQR